MFVIRHQKLFLILIGVIVAASLAAIAFFGVRLSIDFTGGSILEVRYPEGRPAQDLVHERLATLPEVSGYLLQPVGSDSYIVRTKFLDEGGKTALLKALSLEGKAPATEVQSNTVGPTIGNELKHKALIAVGIVMVVIITFISIAFRKVSKPVASWKYGIVAVITLLHDVVAPLGVFVILGHYFGIEIDILFVTAILGTLGYSVHDTIIVFDRIRENLGTMGTGRAAAPFEEIVGASISQTYTRSINTSLTALLVLIALFLLGGGSTKYFSLALLVGVMAGTYSSIFLASPLLVTFYRWQEK